MTGFLPASTSADPSIVQMTERRGEGQRKGESQVTILTGDSTCRPRDEKGHSIYMTGTTASSLPAHQGKGEIPRVRVGETRGKLRRNAST